MSTPCDQIAAFVDGELPPAEADAFREHLATCETCQAELMDQVQASLAVGSTAAAAQRQPAPAKPRAFTPAWARRRTRVLATLSLVAAAVLAVVVVPPLWRAGHPTTGALLLAQAETRTLEGRLGYPGVDGYRPLATSRGGPSATAELDHRVLAQLEDRGDLYGVATAYLLAGDFERAERTLERLPRSPDVDSDRALAALGLGDPERALRLLEQALAAAPGNLRARWNRGVVLRAMGLEMAAAAELRTVAEANEPGWSDEARALARGLREGVEARRKAWTDSNAAGMALALDGAPPAETLVRKNPDLMRLYLYHAVRAAPSRERVQALLPVAEAVDRASRTRTAAEYVQRVARVDFQKRGPLAATYRAMLRDPRSVSAADAAAWVERIRRAGEPDLLLGALLLAHADRPHLDEVEKLAGASVDPAWYRVPLAETRAEEALERGDAAGAEQRLVDALGECRRAGFDYRCVDLQERLSALYNRLERYGEAQNPARAGLEAARRLDDWNHDERFLLDLVVSARLRYEPALSRAYLDEYLQRAPNDCARRAHYHTSRALLAVDALDAAGARKEMEAARACDVPPTPVEAAVYADLLRFNASPEEVARAEERLHQLSKDPTLTPGDRLLIDHMSGRILIERDRAGGQRLLRDVIARSAALRERDLDAHEAWRLSHHVLAMDAGRAGEWEQAVSWLAAEMERPAPASCMLAAGGQDERALFVARGKSGGLQGTYLGGRTRPLREELPPVPPSLLELLRGCERVQVLAEPTLAGRPRLLPADMAWSYLAPAAKEAGAAPNAAPKRVVVSDVEPPPALGLPRLMPWSRQPAPDEVHLRGASATPGAVLAELEDATEAELHVHGLFNAAMSDASFLALSPDASGRYALTATDIQGRTLRGAPLVVLAACDANVGAWRYHAVWSLPAAFVHAGARAVIAPTSKVPDVEAGAFFRAVLDQARQGAALPRALRDVRQEWLRKGPQPWIEEIVIFE